MILDTPGVQGKGSERTRWCIGGVVVGERPGDEEVRLLVCHSFHLRRAPTVRSSSSVSRHRRQLLCT